MKKVIITGATGAIGTALIDELLSHDIEILVLCREDSTRINCIRNHPLITLDFCSLSQLESYSSLENDYDVFFHLAWDGTFGEARNDLYLQNQNIKYALDAVELAKRMGCKTFIGVGSQAEYGRCKTKIYADTPTNPENGYGIGKLAAGLMTRQLAHLLGMKHVWVRVLSVYGPNDGANTMIMSTITKLLKKETPKLTKGEQIWDYLYSGDAAKALFLLADRGVDGKVYPLGSGDARQLSEYITTIKMMIDKDAELEFGAIPYSKNQVMYLSADISELTKDTGWVPKTDFESGIKTILRKRRIGK